MYLSSSVTSITRVQGSGTDLNIFEKHGIWFLRSFIAHFIFNSYFLYIIITFNLLVELNLMYCLFCLK